MIRTKSQFLESNLHDELNSPKLIKKLKHIKHTLVDYQNIAERQQEQIKNLQQKVQSLVNQCDYHNHTVQKLENELHQHKKLIEELTRCLNQRDSQIRRLNKHFKKSESQDMLHKQIETHVTEKQKLYLDFRKLECEYTNLKMQNSKIQMELISLSNRICNNQQNNALRKQLTDLTQQFNHISGKENAYYQLKQRKYLEHKQYKNHIKRLKEYARELNKQNLLIKQQLELYKQQQEAVNKESNQKNEQLTSLLRFKQQELMKNAKTQFSLQKELQTAYMKLAQKNQQEHHSIRQQNMNLLKQNKTLKDDCNALKIKYDRLVEFNRSTQDELHMQLTSIEQQMLNLIKDKEKLETQLRRCYPSESSFQN